MKISKIEKKKRLYLVEIDDTDKLYVTEDTIVKYILSKDKQLTKEEFEEMKEFAQFSHGKNLALYFISFQTRTRKQVYDYLISHDINQSSANNILNELEKENWINDTKFVESYIRQNQLNGDKGPQILKQKLYQKGIPYALSEPIIATNDFSEVTRKVAQKLLKKYQEKLPEKALKDKLMQTLVAKGFSYDQSKIAVAALDFEEDQEISQDLLEKEAEKQFRKFSRKYDGYDLKQKVFQALYRKGFESDDINSFLREFL